MTVAGWGPPVIQRGELIVERDREHPFPLNGALMGAPIFTQARVD